MPGSVNVNEGLYDAFATKRRSGEGKGEDKDDARDVLTDQDDFVSDREEYEYREDGQEEDQESHQEQGRSPDRPAFLSADPHRALRPLADLILPKPASGTEAAPNRGTRTEGEASRLGTAKAVDLGPCLYFGPAGQRCDSRAVEDGFCARHQRSRAARSTEGVGSSLSLPQVTKRAVGAAGIIAVLWPILADLIREIIRLLR